MFWIAVAIVVVGCLWYSVAKGKTDAPAELSDAPWKRLPVAEIRELNVYDYTRALTNALADDIELAFALLDASFLGRVADLGMCAMNVSTYPEWHEGEKFEFARSSFMVNFVLFWTADEILRRRLGLPSMEDKRKARVPTDEELRAASPSSSEECKTQYLARVKELLTPTHALALVFKEHGYNADPAEIVVAVGRIVDALQQMVFAERALLLAEKSS